MVLINVMAVSLDGKISLNPLESDQNRRTYGFTNKADQEYVRSQILEADAVITGANSMRASSGAWEQPNKLGKFPIWVVIGTKGLGPSLKFWQQKQIPRWMVCPRSSDPVIYDPNVVLRKYTPNDMAANVLADLAAAGARRVLLFGGGAVNAMFYEAQLVDELRITICPIVIGSACSANFVDPRLTAPRTFQLLSSQAVESHLFLTYKAISTL